MADSTDTVKDRLARYRQIKINVIGRKSGQTISVPVWFVMEGEKLYLQDTTEISVLRGIRSVPKFRVVTRFAANYHGHRRQTLSLPNFG